MPDTRNVMTVLLCGHGAFGHQHAMAWRETAPCARLLVADPDDAARAAAYNYGIPQTDLANKPATFMEQADIVDIVTPAHEHHPIARAALLAGKPFIIEKPAVKTLAEAEDLAALARKTDLPVQVQFLLRAHPLVVRARRFVDEGRIGRVVAMDAAFTGWKRMRADASLLENDGVHMLDLMRFFSGAAPDHMMVTGDRLLGGPIPETIHARLDYPGEVKGYLRVGVTFGGTQADAYLTGSITTKTFTLIGDEGSITIDLNANKLELTEVTYRRTEGGYAPEIGDVDREDAGDISPVALLSLCFQRFLSAVNGDGAVLCDLEAGAVEITKLLDQARKDLMADLDQGGEKQ